MRLRVLSVLSVVGLLLAAAPLAAQELTASHLAAARDLVQLTGASTSIERIIPALVEDIKRQTVTRPELTKDLAEILKTMQPEMDQQRVQALGVAARSYAKFMSEPEIRDAVAFFRSPAGTKYAKVQPEITEDLVSSLGAWSQLVAEYLQTRVRSEMLKRGHEMQ